MFDKSFFELQEKIFSLFETNQLDDAIKLIEQAKRQFPNRLDKTSFWKACAYTLKDKKSEAVKELNYALDQGVWWNPQRLTGDPDLKTLQDDEEFKSIVAKCNYLFANASKFGKTEAFFYGNSETDVALFTLHWRGSSVEDFAPLWLDELALQKYYYVFPQSSQLYGYNAYCWDKSELSRLDILHTMNLLTEKCTNSKKEIIIAGASQGAKVALELILNGGIENIRGFIFVVPSIKDIPTIEELVDKYSGPKLRGVIITGDQDPFYKYVLDLMPILEKSRIHCKLIIKEGMGHFFPDDFIEILHDAVEFIRIGQ